MAEHGSSSRSVPPADESESVHDVQADESSDSGDDAQLKLIHLDIDGRPVGENSTEFRTTIGKLVKTIVSPHYDSWPNVPQEVKETLLHSLHGMYSFPKELESFIMELASTRLRGWRYTLVKKHIDTHETIAEQKRDKPAKVRQEDWDMFVDRVSKEDHGLSRRRGKTARSFVQSPHTTGRRGAAATAELVRKENPDAKKIDFFLATHVSKDGTAPTPTSRDKIDTIKRIIETDPEARDRDLDHDPVAITAGRYMKQLKTKDKEINKLEKTMMKFMKQATQTSTGSSSSSQGPHEGSTPAVQTGLCYLRDGLMKLVAVASVLGIAPGSTPERLQLQAAGSVGGDH